MSFNFLFNIDIANKKYPNKIDIYENAIKNMLKIKKNINKSEKYSKNTNHLNDFENQKQLIDLENSYKSSLILLDIMQKKMEKAILKKYEIEKNQNEVNKNILMKKKIPEQSPSNFLQNKIELSNKKFLDFDIFKIAENILETIQDTVITTYETIKTETINLFNGTTFKKIFFSSDSTDKKSDLNSESVISLSEYIEQLKRTIEASKIYIRAIIEKIRYQGKIKIVNKLNGNSLHPEYQSSFPDLFTPTPKTTNNDNDFYPFKRLDENFDLEGRKNILKTDKDFRKRMNKNIQESYYRDFISDSAWKVSDQSDSFHNIRSTIQKFQKKYESLKLFNNLDEKFMNDSNPFLFIINDNLIPVNNRNQMLKDFKKIIPNTESQKLISTYANQKFLYQSYLQLISENPDINQYQVKNSRNIYKINFLNDGSIKLVATNLSDLNINNDNYIQKYKSFGIRATIVFPPNNSPIMKYSHFIK